MYLIYTRLTNKYERFWNSRIAIDIDLGSSDTIENVVPQEERKCFFVNSGYLAIYAYPV